MSSKKRERGKEEIEMDDLNKKRGIIHDESFNISIDSQEKDEEFESLRKKYYKISKEIRLNAIEEEKRELENYEKSPIQKYYEGSKSERIKFLDDIKHQMKELEKIKKTKKK
ncbi:hypothetical protein PGB90_008927 [Kerria lacca]